MKYFLYILSTGILMGFSWSKNGYVWLLFLGFLPLLYAIETLENSNKKNKKIYALIIFYFSFIIWNGISVWWLHYSQRPDGSYAWEAYIFPIILNSFFMTVVFFLFFCIKKKINKILGQIFLITLWISFEKIHLEWELAWPWLNLGNAFYKYNKYIQWYEYTGIFGGTLWVWIINISIFNSLQFYIKNKNKILFIRNIILIMLLILFPICISYYIYFNYKEKGPLYNFVIIQPNINPYKEKYYISDFSLTQELIKLSEKSIKINTYFILTPETAIPGNNKIYIKYIKNNTSIKLIKNYINKYPKSVFILGIELLDKIIKNNNSIYPLKKNIDIYNSIIQIDSSNKIQIHHKSKLVPGVEIIPYKNFLEPLFGKILLNFGGTNTSLSKDKINYKNFIHPHIGIKISSIICYESIFGEYVSNFIKKGAEYISIHTNDAWWGSSDQHIQHLYYSCLRAIENRRSIARSANTGISAFINQKGDIISSLNYNKKGSITNRIHANNIKTFYTNYGDIIARISILINILIFIYILCNFFYKKLINILYILFYKKN